MLSAWMANDAVQRDAVLDFWRRSNAMPEGVDPEGRLDQLVATAWLGDVLVGTSTAEIGIYSALSRKFAFYRYLVDPAYRRQNISREITRTTVSALDGWAKDNADNDVIGVAGIWEGRAEFFGRERSPIWDYGAQLIPPVELEPFVLLGYTPEGLDIWITFFDHIRV